MTISNIAQNRKAFFNYQILNKFEAGLVLLGSEVKSLRKGQCSIIESYIDKTPSGELELINSSINVYSYSNKLNHPERRNRKLLLHKSEIIKIIDAISKKGCTAIPLRIYFKNGRVKLEIAVAKGKNIVDKRNTIKERDWKREQGKALKKYNVKY